MKHQKNFSYFKYNQPHVRDIILGSIYSNCNRNLPRVEAPLHQTYLKLSKTLHLKNKTIYYYKEMKRRNILIHMITTGCDILQVF